LPSHDTIPRILPSDLPPEAIERLALAVNYRFSPYSVTPIERAKDFLDAINKGRHGWGGNYLAGLIEELEHPNSAMKLDVIGDPIQARAQKRRGKASIFLLIEPGYAFKIELEIHAHNIQLESLEVYPGKYYPQLVQQARQFDLMERLTHLYEMSAMGSTPLVYEDFIAALDTLTKTHPRLASGRDARILSEGQPDEPKRPARSVITRGRA